jgi:hypothetical protein
VKIEEAAAKGNLDTRHLAIPLEIRVDTVDEPHKQVDHAGLHLGEKLLRAVEMQSLDGSALLG